MFILIIILLTLFSPFIKAQQDVPAASKGDIIFYIDHSGFKGRSSDKTDEEFYLMLFADSLNYVSKNDQRYADFSVDVKATDSYDNRVVNKHWTTEALITQDSTKLTNGMVVYDQWEDNLKPGSYDYSVEVEDQNGDNKGSAKFSIDIPSVNAQSFSSSQIEFVSRVEDTNDKSQFEKAGRVAIPNPSRRYGVLNPILYFYYELYNLPDTTGNLSIQYTIISDKEQKVVKKLPALEVAENRKDISLLHAINVANVSSGIYKLEAVIDDSTGHSEITLARNFEVIQMDYANRKSALSEEEAETEGHILKYIATPDQYNFYKSLDLNGKAQFLIQFWREKDPTPGTEKNEYLEKIQQRYLYANKHFGWGNVEGWDTDRGRVLIKYGNPDEIERHYSETDTLPYEIWTYHQQKDYQFVFADLTNDGRFVLVNSNKENEVHNDSWQELISK
jgi:GWxTD domain-containing protein